MNKAKNLGAIRARIQRFASILESVPLQISMRQHARQLLVELGTIDWPEGAEPIVIHELEEQLFSVIYRSNLGDGPYRESARSIQILLDLLIPRDEPAIGGESAVLTPDEAAEYLGLNRLGVANPGARVRYLVKTKRLRPTRILGRVAFQRSDLDNYLISHTN